MIELHSIVVLERPLGHVEDIGLPDGMRYAERLRDDAELISRTDRRHGRRGDPARIARRFDAGFRYFAIEEHGEPVGWSWVLVGGTRYLDELRWSIRLAPDQVWVRDAFVVPTHRGRRLLVALMGAAASVDGRRLRYFSDVDAVNLPSLHAHRSLGFNRICTVRAITIGRRLTLRMRPPAVVPGVEAIRPAQRLLWLSRAEYEWHRAHIA